MRERMGWFLTILGWYFVGTAAYGVLRALTIGQPVGGIVFEIALAGILLVLGAAFVRWGKRLRAPIEHTESV